MLLSTVYRFPLAVRTRWRAKVLFGKYGYAEATERLIERHGSRWAASHPASPSVPWHSRDDVDRLTARREERVRKGLRQQFGPLNATLRALFGADSVFAGPELTCQKLCSTQRKRRHRRKEFSLLMRSTVAVNKRHASCSRTHARCV